MQLQGNTCVTSLSIYMILLMCACPGAVYIHVQAPKAVCSNVKLVPFNDLSKSCFAFNMYKLYIFSRTCNQYTDSKSFFLTS